MPATEEKQISLEQQAKIILEALDCYVVIDWNYENIYIKGLVNGLNQVQKAKKEA